MTSYSIDDLIAARGTDIPPALYMAITHKCQGSEVTHTMSYVPDSLFDAFDLDGEESKGRKEAIEACPNKDKCSRDPPTVEYAVPITVCHECANSDHCISRCLTIEKTSISRARLDNPRCEEGKEGRKQQSSISLHEIAKRQVESNYHWMLEKGRTRRDQTEGDENVDHRSRDWNDFADDLTVYSFFSVSPGSAVLPVTSLRIGYSIDPMAREQVLAFSKWEVDENTPDGTPQLIGQYLALEKDYTGASDPSELVPSSEDDPHEWNGPGLHPSILCAFSFTRHESPEKDQTDITVSETTFERCLELIPVDPEDD